MNLQRLWQLHRPSAHSSQMGSQLREGVEVYVDMISVTKKLSASDIYLQSKNQFSPVESHGVCYPRLGVSPTPGSRWPTPDKLNGIFVDFFFLELICLGILFFSYWSLAFILRLLILCFYGLCVYCGSFLILVVCLPVYLFSKGRMKGLGAEQMERWGSLQGVGERETMIRIQAMGELFQQKKIKIIKTQNSSLHFKGQKGTLFFWI